MSAFDLDAQAFAQVILDARREARLAPLGSWIAEAQREAAPLIRAVHVLAHRSLALASLHATAANGPALRAENGPSTDNSHNNGHESAARSRGPRIGRSPVVGAEPREVASPMTEPEYLSIDQLARRVPYQPQTIRNLMSRGVLRRDVHYLKPRGRVMFRWSAMRAWLEAGARDGA